MCLFVCRSVCLDQLAPIRIECFLTCMNSVKAPSDTDFLDDWNQYYQQHLTSQSKLVQLKDTELAILNRLVKSFEVIKKKLHPQTEHSDVREKLFESWMHCMKPGSETEGGDAFGAFGNHMGPLKGVGFGNADLDGTFILDDLIDMFGDFGTVNVQNCHQDFRGHGVENMFERESINLVEIWENGMPGFDDCLRGSIPQGGVEAMRRELNVVKHLISKDIIFEKWIGLCLRHEIVQ